MIDPFHPWQGAYKDDEPLKARNLKFGLCHVFIYIYVDNPLHYGFTWNVAMISSKRSWLIAPGWSEPRVFMYPPTR